MVYLIIASDGLYDVCSNEMIYDLAKDKSNPEELAKILLNYSLDNYTRDNVLV
jgi:serine/threonine protein phosphatase PrpC